MKQLLNRQSFKWLSLFAFLFICPDAFAALFDVTPNDKSQLYLGTIFGGSVGSIHLGGGANPMLSRMFQQFNFIIVTIGVMVISYVGILSVVNTAREGEALGKKFSAWVIMRAFVGIIMMIPTPGTGYSFVQVFVMWIVLNGIGAANLVWGVVIDQLSSGIQAVGESDATSGANLNFSTNGSTAAVGGKGPIQNLANNVLYSSVCMQALNAQPGGGGSLVKLYGPVRVIRSDVKPFSPLQDTTIGHQTIKSTGGSSLLTFGVQGPNNIMNLCGQYRINTTYPDTLESPWVASDANTQARLDILISAFNAMVSQLSPAASLLAQNQTPAAGYIAQAISAYRTQVTNLSTRFQNTQNQSQKYKDAKQIGWIHAGNYYFALSQSSAIADDSDAAKLPTATQIPIADGNWTAALSARGPQGWPSDLYTELNSKAPNIKLINDALNLAGPAGYAGSESETAANISIPNLISSNSGSGNAIIDAMVSPITNGITSLFVNLMQGQMTGDPIGGLAKFGWGLMTAAEVAGISMILVSFGLSLLSSPMMCVSPTAPPVFLVLVQLFLGLVGLCVMLWTAGATLNIYLPMVPYLVFTSTAFGWMMAVTEAIVGAPVIALGLVQPSGDEMGKIQAGLGILANIFLRPMLMIFGFILAAGLVRAGVQLVNYGFLSAVTGKPPTSTIFSFIAVLMMYMMFMIGIFNKSFSLIYELPNKVLRYMGVSPEAHEPSELVKAGKEGYEKGADAGAKGLGKGVEGTSKKIEKDQKAQENSTGPKKK